MTPMLVLASPASAHNVCSYHPSDPSTVCLADGTHPTFVPHRYLVVCDRDQDSNRAYARTFRNGVQQPRLEDTTGGQNGCSIYEADVSTLDQFAVCVPTEGCAPPVYKHEF